MVSFSSWWSLGAHEVDDALSSSSIAKPGVGAEEDEAVAFVGWADLMAAAAF
jgi:hypothetical protein